MNLILSSSYRWFSGNLNPKTGSPENGRKIRIGIFDCNTTDSCTKFYKNSSSHFWVIEKHIIILSWTIFSPETRAVSSNMVQRLKMSFDSPMGSSLLSASVAEERRFGAGARRFVEVGRRFPSIWEWLGSSGQRWWFLDIQIGLGSLNLRSVWSQS